MSGQVVILLSTYNGGGFLPAQLASLRAQTHRNWRLLWRDDGSSDDTPARMACFTAEIGPDRCCRLTEPAGNLGPGGSFLALLRHAAPRLDLDDTVAFADQDDVWLPERLACGYAALRSVPTDLAALHCTRQMLVDATLAPFGRSPPIRRKPGFPAALAQNVVTGCTVQLNAPAAGLIARSTPPATTLHDWWSYLVVAAAGGAVLVDDAPLVLYRQHRGNAVGAPASRLRRGLAALQRGPQQFMRAFRANLDALAAQPWLMTDPAAAAVARLRTGLAGGPLGRLGALRLPGLYRQTALETLTFRLWFLLG